jgi:hypothetical protein
MVFDVLVIALFFTSVVTYYTSHLCEFTQSLSKLTRQVNLDR